MHMYHHTADLHPTSKRLSNELGHSDSLEYCWAHGIQYIAMVLDLSQSVLISTMIWGIQQAPAADACYRLTAPLQSLVYIITVTGRSITTNQLIMTHSPEAPIYSNTRVSYLYSLIAVFYNCRPDNDNISPAGPPLVWVTTAGKTLLSLE